MGKQRWITKGGFNKKGISDNCDACLFLTFLPIFIPPTLRHSSFPNILSLVTCVSDEFMRSLSGKQTCLPHGPLDYTNEPRYMRKTRSTINLILRPADISVEGGVSSLSHSEWSHSIQSWCIICSIQILCCTITTLSFVHFGRDLYLIHLIQFKSQQLRK